MKVLHACFNMGYSDGLNYQENCESKWHKRMGYDVVILSTEYCFEKGIWGKSSGLNDYWNKDGIHVIRLPYLFCVPYNMNRQLGFFKGTYRKLVDEKPDYICIHNMQFQDIRAFIKYKKNYPNTKIFVDSHSDYSNSARNWLSRNILYRFWWKPCAKSIEPYAESFFGVMPSRVQFMINDLGISKDKCSVLVMGADDDAVISAKKPECVSSVRRKFNISVEDFLIVTGGKIDKFKTQTLMLMKAIQEIEDSRVKCLIFGSVDEDLKEDFLKLVDNNKIVYAGWVNGDESYAYFASADLVAFPGRHSVYWEQVVGLGMPMLCKYWEGTTHVDLGGNVKFFNNDSINEYKNKILNLYQNRADLDEMRRIAEEYGMKEFSYKMLSKRAIGQF